MCDRSCGLYTVQPAVCVGILEQSMGLETEYIKVCRTGPPYFHRLPESIPGLLKTLKIPALILHLHKPATH
jgi:hypothetical protein